MTTPSNGHAAVRGAQTALVLGATDGETAAALLGAWLEVVRSSSDKTLAWEGPQCVSR